MSQENHHDRFSCILNSPTPEEAAVRLHGFIEPLGISGLVYASGRLQIPLVQGSEAVHRWVAHFIEHDYCVLDPLLAAARKSVTPQFWRAGDIDPKFLPEQARIYEEMQRFGITQGFSLSIRDHQAEAALCFYCEDETIRLQQVYPMVQVGALYLHECIHRLKAKDGRALASTPKNRLTRREQECLDLVREGMTYAQAAQLLRISERTVTFHLQNAKRKLGVTTLVQAIAIVLLH